MRDESHPVSTTRPEATQRSLPARLAGLVLTLVVIAALEVLLSRNIHVIAPAAVLLLSVAFAANRGGPLVGLISAVLAAVYVLHAMSSPHGLAEGGTPITRGVVVGLVLVGVALIVGRLHGRLERVTESAQADRTTSQQQLAGALEDMARAKDEARLQSHLLDVVGQAVIAADRDGRVIYCNHAAAALYGRSEEEMRGALIPDVAPVPDLATGVDETLTRLGRSGVWSGESSVQHPSGRDRLVLVTDSPLLDEHRRPAGIVRVVADLSPLRKAEAAQRLLADAGAILAGSLDYSSTLRALPRIVVPAFADCCLVDLVGDDGGMERLEAAHVDPAREEYARELREVYPLDPRARNHPIVEVIRSGHSELIRDVSDDALRRVASDDAHLRALRALGYRSAMVVPLRTHGRTLGALSFFIAESGRRYGEDDLALAEELARRAAIAIEHARLYEQALLANQAKSDFLAVMSHELRTPLTTIMGYADLLLGGLPEPIGERATVYVERLRAAAAHLLGLIDQILVFARLDLGRTELHPERVAVRDLVRDTAALIEPVAAERGVVFHVAAVGSHVIETDLTKLRQILLNLLSNAVKFTDEGEVWLAARAEDGDILFTVRDTGIGIAPEHLDRVFDPFWQVDQSSTRRVGGTGLGLSVSRRLARVLGGDLTVDSAPGTGTTFCVRLPERWVGASGARAAETPLTATRAVD